LNFKLHAFHTGEIDREEFERLIIDTVKQEIPEAKIQGFTYYDGGVLVQTDLGEVDIEIDWEEINIKETDEFTTIKQN
jgi:hypothetical protein